MPEEQPKEAKPFAAITPEDIVAPPSSTAANSQPLTADSEQPEVVNAVKKISEIITPYFVVVVGLYLYGDNFLIGILPIGVGIALLLKISAKDAGTFLEKAKEFLGLKK